MEKKKIGRGGQREGAGRKVTTGKTTGVISCVLDKSIIKKLDAIAGKFDETRNALLRRIIKAFISK